MTVLGLLNCFIEPAYSINRDTTTLIPKFSLHHQTDMGYQP
jgi:hypothetical protein